MDLKLASIRRTKVAGEELYIPNRNQWLELLEIKILDGREIREISAVKTWLDILKGNEEVLIYIEKTPLLGGTWMRGWVLEVNGELYKVHMETPRCDNCGVEILSANPHCFTFFTPLADSNAIERNMALPMKPCPNCGAELPRPSAWNRVN